MIDGYQLTDLIGKGGMGAVYKAHKSGLDYALKLMIHPTPKAAARFDREAQSLAKVSNHPHIVTIHNYSKSPPWPYLISELIEGRNLRQSLDGRVPLIDYERGLAICIDIASALDHIHSHGILHRDLKPENILIRHSDQKTFLTDFGIAKDKENQDSLTQSGELIGTLNYISPEQLTGAKDKIGPQSDIWSLGVVLYQLTTGQLPFQAPSSAELMPTILFQEPTPPSTINPNLPKGLSTVITSALQKKPEHRYSSAKDFANDCQALLSGQGVLGTSTRFSSRIGGKLPHPQKAFAAITLLLGLILLLSLGFSEIYWNEDDQTRRNRIVQEYETLSQTRQFNKSKLNSLTVQSLENLVFPDKNNFPEKLTEDLEQWIQLELTIKQHAKNDLFDTDQTTNYKRLRKRLNPLYFLLTMPSNKRDPDGLLPQRWQRILLLARQLKSKPEFAKQQLNNLGNADFPESGFAIFLLGLTQVRDKQWQDAEQSFLTLGASQFVSLKLASKKYRLRIYQALLVEMILTKAQNRKGIQRVLKQLKNLSANNDLFAKNLEEAQAVLNKHFENLTAPKSFAPGKKSYLLLEHICGQVPLARPTASAAFHKYMARDAHRLQQGPRALFHHYQRLKRDKDAKLPKEYRRYVFQDTIRLNMQVIHRSDDESQKAAADHLLEISRTGKFFNEILIGEEIFQIEEKFKYFTKACREKPYDPYPRYWRIVANVRKLFSDDKKERQRRMILVEADRDFVVQSKYSSSVFKAMALLNYCEYVLRLYEQVIKKPLPKKLEKKLLKILKDAKSFQIAEMEEFFNMKCRIFQLKYEADLEKPNSKQFAKTSKTLIRLSHAYLAALEDRWKWSQQPSLEISSSSERLRLSLRSYQYKSSHQCRELARIYRHNNQKKKALETLLSYRAFAIQSHAHAITYLQELIHLKLWTRAKVFLKVMPADGYGSGDQERYMKLKASLSQYK